MGKSKILVTQQENIHFREFRVFFPRRCLQDDFSHEVSQIRMRLGEDKIRKIKQHFTII